MGRYEQDIEHMFDFTPERVVASVHESLERIGIDYLDGVLVSGSSGSSGATVHGSTPHTTGAGVHSQRVLYMLFCQVHDAEFAPSNSIILSQTLPALAKLKEEGLVKAIGN